MRSPRCWFSFIWSLITFFEISGARRVIKIAFPGTLHLVMHFRQHFQYSIQLSRLIHPGKRCLRGLHRMQYFLGRKRGTGHLTFLLHIWHEYFEMPSFLRGRSFYAIFTESKWKAFFIAGLTKNVRVLGCYFLFAFPAISVCDQKNIFYFLNINVKLFFQECEPTRCRFPLEKTKEWRRKTKKHLTPPRRAKHTNVTDITRQMS